jgi:hypothetical protein
MKVLKHRLSWLAASLAAGVAVAIWILPTVAGSSGQQTEGPPARQAMSIFATARSMSDALPADRSKAAASLKAPANASAKVTPGQLLLDQSRKVMDAAGTSGVFVVPTQNGWVCLFGATVGCLDSFESITDGVTLGYGDGWPDSTPYVEGFASSAVTGVDVVVDGVAHRADLSDNVFFDRLAQKADWPESVVIHYRNETSKAVTIYPR